MICLCLNIPAAYDCVQPEPPVNGLVSFSWWTLGQYAKISCKDPVHYDFAIFPPPFYKCTAEGQWDPSSGGDFFRFPACSGWWNMLIIKKALYSVSPP
jgi:hypothetical protein